MKRRTVKMVRCVIIIAVFVVIFLFLEKLLMPKYMDETTEGAMIAEYYTSNQDFNVIFMGDCEVYENFSTEELWNRYGINSYIRGSAKQLVWQSYYLLEDTLRFEKPDIVVFNVLAMMYDEPQSEPYNRMTLDGMQWSPSKVRAVQASMTEEEHFIDYLFPILRFHSRWSELKADDVKYLFDKKMVTCNGFQANRGVKPAGFFPTPKKLGNYRFGEKTYEYLDKMTKLCEENQVRLILVKAPSLYPYWYEEWDEQIEEYAKCHRLDYYNLMEAADEIGIDYQTDTYDGGLHLNVNGAEKLSDYFGMILVQKYQVKDRREEEWLQEDWSNRIEAYDFTKQ